MTKVNFGLTSTACAHVLYTAKCYNYCCRTSIYLHISSLTGCTAQQQQGTKHLTQLQQGQKKYASQQGYQGQFYNHAYRLS